NSSSEIPRPKDRIRRNFSTTASCANCNRAVLSMDSTVEAPLQMTRRLAAVFLFFAILCAPAGTRAQEGRRLRAGYASLSGNIASLWAAKETGSFKKYGLDIDLIAFPSGTEGMAAMIAGEIEFLAIAGSTTASAAI